MTFIGIALIIVVVWWLTKKSNKTEVISITTQPTDVVEETIITEEVVFEVQSRFETKLEEEIDFPDGIRGYPVHIYKNLMSVWYKKLSGENRYQDKMIQQIRKDWLSYIYSIEERATCHYLNMETSEDESPEKVSSYRERAFMASQKIQAIEDGFASAIGKEAVEELRRLREINDNSFGKFDKFGNLAPEGFEYDYSGELHPE